MFRADGPTDRRTAWLLAVLLSNCPSVRLFAFQCPDGTPPPCRTAAAVSRGAAPAPLSVAVLPFENRSPDGADDYLAEGLTDEIGNRLARLGRLQIKSRGLVREQWRRTPQPVAAARALNVSWFVHGNLRHVGQQLLVNVELVRAGTGEEAWGSRFPRSAADVFAVQAEIAESVAVAVGGRLTPDERATLTRRLTSNNEAYRLWLFGNVRMARRTEEDMRAAVTAYQQALALDPAFAAAWARLGLARNIQTSWGWDSEAGDSVMLSMAFTAARRALALDSLSADAWLALGASETDAGNMPAAREAFARSVRLDSLNADAWHHYGTLYSPECVSNCLSLAALQIPLMRRALAIDPSLRNTWRHVAAAESDSGLYAQAEAHLDTALSYGPWPPAYADRAVMRYLQGKLDSAAADYQRGRDAPQNQPLLPLLIQAARGDSAAARERLARWQAESPCVRGCLLQRAALATLLGRPELALRWLEEVRQQPGELSVRCGPGPCSPHLPLWRALHDPFFASLRSEPRFQRLWNETRPRLP